MTHSSQAHFDAAMTLINQPLPEGPYKQAVEEILAYEEQRGHTRSPVLEGIARSGVTESLNIVRRDAHLGGSTSFISLFTGDGVSHKTAAELVDEILKQENFL